jgi:hypothetical protein
MTKEGIKYMENSNEFPTLDCEPIEADVFIIPNSLAVMGRDSKYWSFLDTDLFYSSRKANGIDTDDTSANVQVWITNSENDNMVDDPFRVTTKNGDIYVGHLYGYLPVEIFDNKVEGDTVDVILLGSFAKKIGSHLDADGSKYFYVTGKLKLNQLGYRYRQFGRFEEVLSKLI